MKRYHCLPPNCYQAQCTVYAATWRTEDTSLRRGLSLQRLLLNACCLFSCHYIFFRHRFWEHPQNFGLFMLISIFFPFPTNWCWMLAQKGWSHPVPAQVRGRNEKKKIEKKLCGVIIIARQANTQQSLQEFCKQHISMMWLLLPLSLPATATTAADYDVVVVDFSAF